MDLNYQGFIHHASRDEPQYKIKSDKTDHVSNNRWITPLAARFGVTNGPWLFYGKAGGGWVGSDDFTVTNLTTGASITGSNNSNSGWLVGAASSGLSRPIGRRKWSIIFWG